MLVTGQLDFRRPKHLGTGKHAKVFLAPLTFPSTPTVNGAVAVKYSDDDGYCSPQDDPEEMLRNEGQIYNAFPRHLQDPECGAPAVPKFYGFYEPSVEAYKWDDNHDLNKEDSDSAYVLIRRHITPILLLEACGEIVLGHTLSNTDRWALRFYKIYPQRWIEK